MSHLITTFNPATGREIASYPVHDSARVELALQNASNSYVEWRKTTLSARASLLKSIAGTLRKEKEYLARLATEEMGKPICQSREEIEKCARTLEYYAEHGAAFLADEIVETDALKSYVSYRSLGVVLAIMPWNFPYWQVFRALGPIFMAGNTLILKHSSNVCGCARAIEKVILQAKAPRGLLQTLLIPASQVGSLIDHPSIAAITLTGSAEAGRKVAEAAGRNLKKTVLELGGSDAYIILEDADLQLAADVLVKGRLVNSGQSCVAAKRFVVVKPVRKQFEKLVKERMISAQTGDPMDERNTVGPMARADLRDQLHRQVMQSMEMGAKALCGCTIPEGEGYYYTPGALTGVKKGMPAYQEELFGPVAVIIEAKDIADAVRIANDSEYGLGSGIFSANRKLAEQIARNELEAGNSFVNDFVHSDPRLPFGGIKSSGYGRELGVFGMREFVNIKTVYVK